MKLFGRRQPVHRALADAAGLSLGDGTVQPPGLSAAPPGWDGEQRGEPGIHGVPRARKWDVVVSAQAAGLRGDAVHFAALPDRSLILDEDEPEAALGSLADAVEAQLAVPYRAEGVRRDDDQWAVGARRISVVQVPSLEGDEAELVVTADRRALTVDGRPHAAGAPALEAAGAELGTSYVVRASRLDGDLWEVEATPL